MKKFLIFTVLAFLTFVSCQKDASTQSSDQVRTTSVSNASSSKPQEVTITAVYDFSTFPFVYGTFTTTGALDISGTTTMNVGPKKNGVAHCEVVLYATDGTITIHQECQFHTDPPAGQWQIVSGTGAYKNLKGNGSLLMPPDTEAMTGVIYQAE